MSKIDNSLILELGDIIEINAPNNTAIHNHKYYIEYIDNNKMNVISLSDTSKHIINFNKNGFSDENILSVSVISRSENKGFARQNDLNENTWIEIKFYGDIPTIITGEINNIIEDMIEITTYPDLDVIFIDFAYKGLPEDIPIEYINITEKPSTLAHISSLSQVKEHIETGSLDEIPEQEYASMEMLDSGESVLSIPEDSPIDPNLKLELSKLYSDANSIVFGKKLGAVREAREKPPEELRYNINTQVDDLLDNLYSKYPNVERNESIKNNIHRIISRFKELRSDFSKFDDNNNIYDIIEKGFSYKPLVESLNNLNKRLLWILPIVANTKYICIQNDDIISNDTVHVPNNGYDDIINFQEKYYINKQNNIDYQTMLNTIDNTYAPFTEPDDTNLNSVITSQNVNDSFEAIIDNFNEFNSSIVNKNQVKQRKFIIQKYNLGMTSLKQVYDNDLGTNYKLSYVTNNDKMFLKSFITLPSSIIEFSKINLNSSSILEKSVYNQNFFNFFQFLNKKTNIHTNFIDDFNTEIDYKKYNSSSTNNTDLLNNINHFQINNENFDTSDYTRYLETIFPKTINLLEIFRNKINNCFSINAIVDKLEPFLLYKDDITYQMYNKMRFYIKENIKNLREQKIKKETQFNKIKKSLTTFEFDNKISNILKDNDELHQQFNTGYSINKNDTTSETLYKIYNSDNSLLFNSMLSMHMNILNTPVSLLNLIDKNDIDYMDNENKYTNDCFKRYLAKKYYSFDKLQDDNNINIFFDKDLDDSPYHLLKQYESDIKNMNKPDAIDFLNQNLIHKHGINQDISLEIANILYNKEKPVTDDHYAIVELKPKHINDKNIDDPAIQKLINSETDIKMKKFYYKRVKNVWIKDESITDLSFFDTNELFCNISSECFKNTKTNVCESDTDTINRVKKFNKEQLLNEFDTRFNINADELQNQNLKRVNYYNNLLTLRIMIDNIKLYKNNNLSSTLGRYAVTDPIIKSPHFEKLQKIINDNDFIRKQANIIKFVDAYTRKSSFETESIWWFYCKDSNIQILPTFVYKLAFAYTVNNNYFDTLNNIVANQGYTEGKFIFDQYSDWKIKDIDFVNEDLYSDTGQKIIHNDILQNNINIIPVNLPRTFENKNSEKIFNVFSAIADNIHITKENIETEVMQMSTEIIEKEILSKQKYDIRAKKKKEKTDKDSIPYSQYYDETLLFIVSSVLLVYIQSLIPSVIVKRSFPGCTRSFTGYPLDGIEDLSGIKYISCVISRIKSPYEPWNSVKKYNEKTLVNRIKSIIENIIVKRIDVMELIRVKKEYLILNPDEIISKEVGVEKWNNFLPPLNDIKLPRNISNVTPQFMKELHQNILKSRFKQFDMINTIVSKNFKFGLSIIQSINNIVHNEPLLLNTVSLIPWIDNACCNEETITVNTIEYFKNKDDTILHDINAVKSNSIFLKDINNMSKASILIHKDTFGSLYPDLELKFSEETIYNAILHHCRYDTIYDVPLDYKSVCDEKPDGYDPSLSIEEKIVFLKKNGRKFTIDTINTLMNIINKNNTISYSDNLILSPVQPLIDFLLHLDIKDECIIQEPLRKKMLNVLNNYKPDKFYHELSDNNRKLKNYLLTCNKKMLVQILDFIYKYGSLNQNKFDTVKQNLFDVVHWNIDTNNNSYFDNGIHNIFNHVRNTVYDYSKIYPNIICNGKINNTVHKHWGLSEKHNSDILNIIDNHYSKISEFIKDESLHKIITMTTSNIMDLNTFINLIPINTPFKDDNDKDFHNIFDKETILEICKYCVYCCLYEYILLCDNDEIFNSNIEYNKSIINNEKTNPSDVDIITDSDDLLQEIEITIEKVQNIKEKVAKLILSFINIDIDNKNNSDFSYQQTYHKMKKIRNSEKNNIVSKFGEMERSDRKIENVLKHYKLGQWNVANQKGFTNYDKKAYDDDALLNAFQDNKDTYELSFNTDLQDTFIIDTDNGITEDVDEEINYEGRDYDFSHLGEDFYDGEDGVYSDDENDF
jgi:hypothetical protein